jgi:protoporphyrinogen oxidase
VGGNAASFELDGLRVDFGSHRLHPSCAPDILADIRTMLGNDLLDRPRHGRIRLRARWVHFPLKPLDLVTNLPLSFAAGALRDAVLKPRRAGGEESFATVLERGLGPTICRDFYFPYATKIWGLPPQELDAEQARRRVSAGSVGKMIRKVLNGLPGLKPKGGGRFFYPRHGFGQMSDAYAREAERLGVRLRLGAGVTAIEHAEGRVTRVRGTDVATEQCLASPVVLSTIPLPALVRAMSPSAPSDVLDAAAALRTRAMLLIYLVLETERFTEFDAHYFPGEDIAITRLSEPKNYGLAALPRRTVLCAELPCTVDDQHWRSSDEDLGRLVQDALDRAGLPVRVPVRTVATRRLRDAYPIYTKDYRPSFERLDHWVGRFDGLVSLGRQGLFAHDNTHHTLATAYAAVACLSDDGHFDRARWAEHRREFETHVVED